MISMAIAPNSKKTVVSRLSEKPLEDEVLLEKVRWSSRERLRKQLAQLSMDFFDEVDDFLFSSGKQGQFEGDNACLASMREIRTKQSLFNEKFIGTLIRNIKQSQGGVESKLITYSSTGLGSASERVEIDLALKSMERKAEKVYLPHLKQIDELNSKLGWLSQNQVISGAVLIHASVLSFVNSQVCFSLPLDVRLVFIKLFEQHFLLKMEKILQDIVSILTNVSDEKFVEKLYSSSSAFETARKTSAIAKTKLNDTRENLAMAGREASTTVEAAVAELVSELCDSHRMPLFIERMIRTQWRAVMFLIGLNTGSGSEEWKEAKLTVMMLSAAAAEGAKVSEKEKNMILDQVEQGFKLIQADKTAHNKFIQELRQLFRLEATKIQAPSQSLTPRKTSSPGDEASISPAGKRVLNQDDLNELANLLGGGEKTQQANSSRGLDNYLSDIEQITDGQCALYRIEGEYQECRLFRPFDDSFEVHLDGPVPLVKRSKLGLAMALKQEDLCLETSHRGQSMSSVTVLDHQLH